MPELPEVEVISKKLKNILIGKKIIFAKIRCEKLRYYVSKEIYNLKNEKIINIKRKAKYIIIDLIKGSILIHLGMSGSIKIINLKNSFLLPNKHDHIDIFFNSKIFLRYNDPRKFGLWLWSYNIKQHFLLNNLGIEPLSKKFDSNYIYQSSRLIKKPIKIYLMDNKIVVGIGNIYANESLFKAKILPNRLANSLNKIECINLNKSIKKTLKKSIELGGTTIKNFFQINGEIGKFYAKLKVYKKYGSNCLKCCSVIKLMKHNKRSTYFCPKCQK